MAYVQDKCLYQFITCYLRNLGQNCNPKYTMKNSFKKHVLMIMKKLSASIFHEKDNFKTQPLPASNQIYK